jgi:WD40 repeat protein
MLRAVRAGSQEGRATGEALDGAPVAFIAGGARIAIARRGGAVVLTDAATQRDIATLVEKGWPVSTLVASPDGRTLVAGGGDADEGPIAFWDVSSADRRHEIRVAHAREVRSIAFGPDGHLLASGDVDRAIVLWDVPTRTVLGEPLRGHREAVTSLAFSPGGKQLASASGNPAAGTGEVILWDMDPDSWVAQACAMANRDLTRAEWESVVHGSAPFEPACPRHAGPGR